MSTRFITQFVAHYFHPRRSNNHRPQLLHPKSLGVLAVFIALFAHFIHPTAIRFAPEMGRVLGYASHIDASEVVAQTNAERAQAGVASLVVNEKLNQAAAAKARYMFDKQFWAHIAPDGTQPWAFFKQANYTYKVAGENLARDFDGTPEMMAAWMASPTHKANIVNNRYSEIGVAVVNGNLLGEETTLVVQLFGTPVGTTAPTAKKTPAVPTVASSTTLGLNSANSSGDLATPLPLPETAELALLPAETQPPTQTFVGEQPTVAAQPDSTVITPEQEILGAGALPLSKLQAPALFSPLQLMKAFFLGMILLVSATLIYDTAVVGNQDTIRLVGKNMAHLSFLFMVTFLLLYFKSGVIG